MALQFTMTVSLGTMNRVDEYEDAIQALDASTATMAEADTDDGTWATWQARHAAAWDRYDRAARVLAAELALAVRFHRERAVSVQPANDTPLVQAIDDAFAPLRGMR